MKKFNNKKNECINFEGRELWLSRSCAVAIIVKALDKILLTRRGANTPDYQHKLCTPCGYMDWNESGFDAARRELYEETGIFLPEQHDKQPFFVDTRPTERQNITLRFYVELNYIPETTMEHSDEGEVEEILWLSLDEIETLPETEFAFNHKSVILYHNQ